MPQPLISILVPAYNVEDYVGQCLQSIVGQTYGNLQVVVVDDGSTDRTGAICDDYAARYPFVEVVHTANGGVAAARNTLLSKIRGEYFLFVDSDDWVEPDMVATLLELMDSHQSDIAMCRHSYANEYLAPSELERCNSCQTVWNQEEAVKKFLFHKELSGSLWNKLVKTSLLHNHRFNADISYGEDALFVWKLLQHITKLAVTEAPLYHYRSNPASLSHKEWTPDKKGSGHLAWAEICADTSKRWPKFLRTAKARFALEDMWGLYFAALADYKCDESIKLRQRNIRANLGNIYREHMDSIDRRLMALVLSHWYGFGAFLRKLKG